MKNICSETLRFIACGSVDDGKSTLIGRLLYDSKMIFEDQLAQLKKDSKKVGTQGKEIDFALIVDGLEAEREQGITIDVAYRFFSTEKRKFIVADTPGHEEYTRNMITGASTSQLAIILIDAQKGVLEQTKRHSFIVNLLGIKHVVVAINKMDLVNYDEHIFNKIVTEYNELIKNFNFISTKYIPLSALKGDNVFSTFENTKWYTGPSLIETLENIQIREEGIKNAFSMPVQWVNRSSSDFRGYAGTITSGKISKGDVITTASSNSQTSIKNIYGPNGELDEAFTNQAVTLTLQDELDISRGDIILRQDNKIIIKADKFAAHLVWMDQDSMLPERNYIFRFNNNYINGQITAIFCKIWISRPIHITHRFQTHKNEKSIFKKVFRSIFCARTSKFQW